MEYFEERSFAFNAWSEFSCPDTCERYGCRDEGLHVSVSLVDLLHISLVSGRKVFDLFVEDCKIGFDPLDEDEPWVGRVGLELLKPCHFLVGKGCAIYPGRPMACALFPEAHSLLGKRETMLGKDIFRKYPCLQGPPSLSPRRREVVEQLLDMAWKETFLSDFYLFAISPLVIDLKNVAGESFDGVETSKGGKATIPQDRIEKLLVERLEISSALREWEEKVEGLDRSDGAASLLNLRKWTDEIAATRGKAWPAMAYQFEGNRLVPIRLRKS